jgi:glutathione peroxidase
MRLPLFISAIVFLTACSSAHKPATMENNTPATAETVTQTNSIYQFAVPSIEGGTINFSQYKGKKILVVNTASKCGYTPQYAGLEKLYETHKNDLVIVGFPANNFGGQEPGTNQEIEEFCKGAMV